jgi:hypothetical protein
MAALAVGHEEPFPVRAQAGLTELTGLPTSKALRALCIEFGLLRQTPVAGEDPEWTPARLEDFLRGRSNPYDLLCEIPSPSLLDLGAGDLSFLAEVAESYRARQAQGQRDPAPLTLHAVDRVRPGSRLGARYQPAAEHYAALTTSLHRSWLRFKYWGDQDMCAVDRLGRQILPRYTIVTCHAPASPTFAYEPSRLSAAVIQSHLRQTKGASRLVREDREEALEVQESGRSLLFPPWKFEIRGPLALLKILAQRSRIGVLSCVDAEVFWELLVQLVECPALQNCSTVFTPSLLARHLGSAYERLAHLPSQERVVLGDLFALRKALPIEFPTQDPSGPESLTFRYVEVRRGASFPGLPTSGTARVFPDLSAETTPWMLVLVPDRPV